MKKYYCYYRVKFIKIYNERNRSQFIISCNWIVTCLFYLLLCTKILKQPMLVFYPRLANLFYYSLVFLLLLCCLLCRSRRFISHHLEVPSPNYSQRQSALDFMENVSHDCRKCSIIVTFSYYVFVPTIYFCAFTVYNVTVLYLCVYYFVKRKVSVKRKFVSKVLKKWIYRYLLRSLSIKIIHNIQYPIFYTLDRLS